MSDSIEAQKNYLQASLDSLTAIRGQIDEFVEKWKKSNVLPIPTELDALKRNFQLLVKSYKQCSSASATHASNIIRQLGILEGFDESRLDGINRPAFHTAVDRIEKSLKIIAVELDRLRERNTDLKTKVTESRSNNQQLSEVFTSVGHNLDKLANQFQSVNLKQVGSVRFEDLYKSEKFAEIKRQGSLGQAKQNFEKFQATLNQLNNLDF